MTGKETDKGIWCLFSIDNNDDQPENNLVRFWFNRPSIETLASFMGYPTDKANDEDIVKIVLLWQGTPQRFTPYGTDYRLQYVEEGTSL